jgi:hypothetical protein
MNIVAIEFGSTPNFRIAIMLEAPQSMRKDVEAVVTRKQVLNRPPEPNASPEPMKCTCIVASVAVKGLRESEQANTPTTDQSDERLAAAPGLASISSEWRWKNMSAAKAKETLDKHVALRAAIAHRGKAAASVMKAQIEYCFGHEKQLVGKTKGEVSAHVAIATGKPLW